mgnify:CR=1 FL=1
MGGLDAVLLHRDRSLRRAQFFSSARWPGYTMLNATMQSTKSAAPLAAAWAVHDLANASMAAGIPEPGWTRASAADFTSPEASPKT